MNLLCDADESTITNTFATESLGPYVLVTFKGDNRNSITVGNDSSPATSQPNTAVIKSFSYGASNGHKAKIKIVDQEGGKFATFLERLWKYSPETTDNYSMQIEWGWMYGRCTRDITRYVRSPKITVLPLDLEIDYSEGIIIYNITGADSMQVAFSARQDNNEGEDSNPLPLKEAIRRLAAKEEPIFEVEFPKVDGNGTILRMPKDIDEDKRSEYEWEFEEKALETTGGVWTQDGQNKKTIIEKWLNDYKAKHNKGFLVMWDNESETPKLLIVPQHCNIQERPANPELGTFLVNGGNSSNVIRFKTNMNWIAGLVNMSGRTGSSNSSLSSQQHKKEDVKDDSLGQGENMGIAMSTSPNKNSIDIYGEEDAVRKSSEANDCNAMANKSVLPNSFAPIEAELIIQGNPSRKYIFVSEFLQKYINIIVIDPYYLSTNSNRLNWLREPGCNDILTNRYWMISGIDHSIQEGSYQTTIKVLLVTPGIDAPKGTPLGGQGSGGRVI